MPLISVDTTTLTGIINQCVDLSMDGQLSPSMQREFLTLAKRLRGSLVNLLSARFTSGTQAVLNANSALTSVNENLQSAIGELSDISKTVGQVTDLVTQLDNLIKSASSFA